MAEVLTATPQEAIETLPAGSRRSAAGSPECPHRDAARRTGIAPARSQDAEIIAEHVRHTADLLLERARVLADAVEAGRVAVVRLS
ncbi:hypothetical protein AB0C76_33165 [Kitasatospora sp. NPDC048722]|uniref:hypothetical protein n=1 Tax=Kitasatospora sp. NPDC048722 TaxID=3155639 RepID=UPI00340397E2